MDWLVYLFIHTFALQPVPPTECWIHREPRAKLVYLHGIMNTKTGFGLAIEDENRRTLQEVANQCHMSIALPVSDYFDGPVVKWYSKDLKNSDEKAKMAEEEVRWSLDTCLAEGDLPTVVLGFSAGGYTVNHLQISSQWADRFLFYFASGTNPLLNSDVIEIPQQRNNHLLDVKNVINALTSAGVCL